MNAVADLEDERLLQLVAAIKALLADRDLGKLDAATIALIAQMRDVVQAWLTQSSPLTHDEMIAALSRLTGSLSGTSPPMDTGNRVLH